MSLVSWFKWFMPRSRCRAPRHSAYLGFENLEDRFLLSVGHTTSFFRADETTAQIAEYTLPSSGTLNLDRAVDALKLLGGDMLAYGFWTEEERSPQSWSDFRAVIMRLQSERPDLQVLAYVGSPTYAGNGTFSWVSGDSSDDVGPYSDYLRWSREVAQLGVEFPIIKGILLDDFSVDMQRDAGIARVFTPEYVSAIRAAGRAILPSFRVEAVAYLSSISAYDAKRFEGRLDAVQFFYRHADAGKSDADPHRIGDEIEMFYRAYSAATLSPLATIYHPSSRPGRVGDVVSVEATLDLKSIRTDLVIAHFDTVGSTTSSGGWVKKTLLLDGEVIYDADLAADDVEVQSVTIPAAQIAALRANGRRTASLTMSLTVTQSFTRWSYAANIFVSEPDDVYLEWASTDTRGSNSVVTSRDLVAPPERYIGLYGGSPSFMDVTPEYTRIVQDYAQKAYAEGDVRGVNVWEVMMQDNTATTFAIYEDYFEAVTLDGERELYSTGNFAFNWGGAKEKWISGKNGSWYYILPTGEVYKWAGTSLDGELVASLDPSFYAKPQRLFAAAPNRQLEDFDRAGDTAIAVHFDQQLGLQAANNNYENWGGRGEKWLQGRKHEWYFITPDGSLYEWDRQPTATGRLMATFSPTYHTSLELLYDAHAYAIDSLYGLDSTDDRWDNWAGLDEKWIQGGRKWYYLLPDGTLWLSHGRIAAGLSGTQVAILDRSYYLDPSRLVSAQNTHAQAHLE